MRVQAKIAALQGIKPHEYAARFLFGGLCTVAAGLVARRFGPEIGGIFLAFPAIFPAGASLIEKHEKEHKRNVGSDGTNRGRVSAGIDAAGAALGSIGLTAFAIVAWQLLSSRAASLAILCATLTWAAVSVFCWLLRKSRIGHLAVPLGKSKPV